MNRIRGNVVIPRIAAICCLALSDASGTALSEDEYFPTEPPLADSGWTVPYNELLLACYQGAMDACDRVGSDRRVRVRLLGPEAASKSLTACQSLLRNWLGAGLAVLKGGTS